MQYIESLVSHYGWEGIALIVIILILFAVQICFYAFRYLRIAKYRDSKRQTILDNTPTVSVIVPLWSEDYTFLDERLPLFMAQEGVNFEVVIVYVGSSTDFFDDLLRLQQMLPNIVVTKIESNPRFPISIKTALNVGVKASHYEHMIFTTSDCYPVSDRWLSLMASGFKRGDVVLGYTALESADGFARYFMRMSRMMTSVGWLSSAVRGKAYRGHRTNIGWTKTLYFEVRGFSHLNMNIGEDDLFVQRLLERTDRVSVILSPKATLRQLCWGSLAWWTSQLRLYRSAVALYPARAQHTEMWELRSRILFTLAVVVAIIFMPFEVKIFAAVLLLIRFIITLVSLRKVAQRLGEEGVLGKYPIFDFLNPIYMYCLHIFMNIKRDKRVWR
ncbi:MAG: glycosyltransferase [Rikenellaceae bacterium]